MSEICCGWESWQESSKIQVLLSRWRVISLLSYATVPPGKTFLPTQCILVIVRWYFSVELLQISQDFVEKKLQWLLNSTHARVCVFLGGLNFPQFGYHRGWECRALVWWLVVNWNLLALCANKGTSNPYHLIHTMWVWLALWCNWFVWIYGAKAL